MATVLNTAVVTGCNLNDEKAWEHLTYKLRLYVGHRVYSSRVRAWKGKEKEIIDDIVQESVCRCFEYARRSEHGEALPIYSLERLAKAIAHNYYVDLLRRDRRLLPSSWDDVLVELASTRDIQVSPFEIALEYVSQEEFFACVAREVARFPRKQREALLIDLANRMDFDAELTPLQKAFASVGIDLQPYQRLIPLDARERARDASLRSLAYRRLARCMHIYIAGTEDSAPPLSARAMCHNGREDLPSHIVTRKTRELCAQIR